MTARRSMIRQYLLICLYLQYSLVQKQDQENFRRLCLNLKAGRQTKNELSWSTFQLHL